MLYLLGSGPSEPKHDINTFLKPLVTELLMRVPKELKVVRCALLCVACDLPAGRKVCGFLSHFGCSRCMKPFPGTVGSMDYSGFVRSEWQSRTNQDHRSNVLEINRSHNKTQRQRLEIQYGCRYSVLLALPYFDPPRMLTVDPMHNLFLGTVKHLMKNVWITNGIPTPSKLIHIQECMHVPPDVGRIPYKVESGFSGFTADQLKNWVTIYSIPALYGIVAEEHLECWRTFVLACRLLCKYSLSPQDVQLADALLLQFCRRVERTYGCNS